MSKRMTPHSGSTAPSAGTRNMTDWIEAYRTGGDSAPDQAILKSEREDPLLESPTKPMFRKEKIMRNSHALVKNE